MQSIYFMCLESHSFGLRFPCKFPLYEDIFHWFKKTILHKLCFAYREHWYPVVNSSTRHEDLQPNRQAHSSISTCWETPLLASCWEDHSLLSFTTCSFCLHRLLTCGELFDRCFSFKYCYKRSAVTLCGTDLPKAAGDRRAALSEKCMLVVGMGSWG